MGIINITPDSFSDGGVFLDPGKAIDHGLRLVEEGADILDIGGESTRPDAVPVFPEEEMDRVLPVIEGLKDCGAVLSIDTRHAATMKAAISAGVAMVNDVTALTGDGDSLAIIAAHDHVSVCLMHMRGTPQTMQQNPQYKDIIGDVSEYLTERIDVCLSAGISRERLVIDPGIGFGKTLQHNLALLKNLAQFQDLDVPVLLGVSRKSFIEKICPDTPASERLPGSLAASIWACGQGVDIVRVHDVAATKQAFRVYQAIQHF